MPLDRALAIVRFFFWGEDCFFYAVAVVVRVESANFSRGDDRCVPRLGFSTWFYFVLAIQSRLSNGVVKR